MLISRVQDPDLIAGFYEAATEPARWPLAWASLCRMFEAPAGVLFLQRAPDAAPHILASQPTPPSPSAEFHAFGPGFGETAGYRSVLGQETATPLSGAASLMDDFAPSPSPCGALHVLGASVELGGAGRAGMRLHRPIDGPAFSESDRSALDSIVRHLAVALRLAGLLDAERRTSLMRGAALDQLRHGAVVTDAGGTVRFANDAAWRLTEQGGLRLEGDGTVLACEQPVEAQHLAALVREAAEGGEGGCMQISGRVATSRLAAVVTSLPRNDDTAEGLALVTLRDLGDPGDMSQSHLMDLFGLTAAEASILPQLLAGESASLIAQSRGVRVATVRTQAARVLAKTGATNLRALASMVAALE